MLTGARGTTRSELCDPVALVASIQDGDAEAERRLVDQYGRAVAIILDRHTNGRPEAEDLYQDTFCTALTKLRNGELRNPAKLPEYLSQIARYLALEHYRKAARRRTSPDSEAVDSAVAVHRSPLAEILMSERATIARKVIGELRNQRDREVLFRFYIAEEDKDLIASDLGLSRGQLNRVLHRARERYRELYLRQEASRDKARDGTGAAIRLLIITLLWMRAGV
jgi:RNA polymerase sigma-70 factor (ECF subfamily)